jgi:hypothetical protein
MRAAIGIFLLGLVVAVFGYQQGKTLHCGMMMDFRTAEETARHLDACGSSRWEVQAGMIIMALAPVLGVALWLKSKL